MRELRYVVWAERLILFSLTRLDANELPQR